MNPMLANSVVMLITNPFRPDSRVLKEAMSLSKLGYRITIIAWDRQAEYAPHEELTSHLQVIRIQMVRSHYGIGARQFFPLLHFWREAAFILNELQPRLLHCHDFDTLPLGMFLGLRHHIPVIYDAHEYYADLVATRLNSAIGKLMVSSIRKIEPWLVRRADAVITVDENLAAYYRSLNTQVSVVGHYPSRNFTKAPSAVFSRSELNLVYHGRLSVNRGLLLYLDILRELLAAGIPSRLHLAGVYTPISEKDLFMESSRGVRGAIIDYGWVSFDKVPELLCQADVGLVLLQPEPRYIAALPVKLFEYMAVGLPVLASDFPSIQQVVSKAQCGATIDPTSSQAAIQILKEWWISPQIPRQMGERGYQSIQQQYNWELLVDRLDGLYRSIMVD
jgi:glycosyltransferase involved in cell wall biosynthesis